MRALNLSLLAALLCSCAAPSVTYSQSTALGESEQADPRLERGREVVKYAADNDFFFWNRFFNRLETPVEFGLPDSWYTPNRIIEGGVGANFPVRDEAASAVSDAAWLDITSWAQNRETDTLLVLKDGVIERQLWVDEAQPGKLVAVRSLAKTLPGLLVGIAIKEGVIGSVDEPLANYIPEWGDDPRGAITLRQVLHQSSGLASVALKFAPDNLQIRLAEGADVNVVALGWPYEGPPDTTWTVNQVDTQILAIVLERATGESYADYLSSRIWSPLGAGTATMNTDSQDMVRAYCCMRARLYDWARVGELLRQQGRVGDVQIVPQGWMEEMQRPSSTNPYMGYHLWLGWKPGTQAADGPKYLQVPHSRPYRTNDVIYMVGGGIMSVWVVPSKGLTIVRGGGSPDLSNWDHSFIVNRIIDDLDDREGP